ncbi:hypothetical protein [Pseudomonas sp. MH9.3]|uniref:hypothetical protein n=1 Tax=Pseudomonas sp. MH9.3 TaxID=3048630 RepID=UPI002AC9773B|nr:hypothetical protein [Pseudomonas sp. MH9.3]MEB0106146.1 hypothetical protein [Pseudomonas sp. MH9.3]WPX80443.1 hypothetical protein RHM60_04830 [Pseudomonas sp. MH9.3]WQG57622.1 hypothetical protein RHM66_21995 [Pseudomonas sp. RTB3]
MSVDLLFRGIQEENSRDLEKEVVRILANENYWERLKEAGQLGEHVQVMAISPDAVQYCFFGIPVEFDETVNSFQLKTGPRKLN